jgi:hypothetical protein
LRAACAGVTGGDLGLQRVRPECRCAAFGAFERGDAATNEEMVPAAAILIEKQNVLTRRTDARVHA